MKVIFVALSVTTLLYGCGVEMLGTQATVAKMQKTDVDVGRKAYDATEKKMDKVESAAVDRASQLSKIE